MNENFGRKKKLRVRYRLSVVFFAAVLIFGIMFYRYMKTVTLEDVLSENRTITVFSHNAPDKAENREDGQDSPAGGDSGSQQPEDPSGIVNPVPECEAADSSYIDDCVFIGDSIVYGLSSYGVVPSSNVFASVSMSVSKAETEKIDTQYGSVTAIEAVTQMQPKIIYIMLGSNGAAYMSASEMYQSYQAFLNKVRLASPDSEVYIISTPPVTFAKESSVESPIKNSDIDSLNEKLLEYADSNGIHFLDLNSALKDSSGYLPAESAENDGMHFKYSTYETFIDYILSHIA